MAGKIIADTIEGTTTTETVDGSPVTIPNSINTMYVVNGSAKAWLDKPNDGASINDSFGVSSLDDDAAGDFGVNVIVNFSSASYAPMGSCDNVSSNNLFNFLVESKTSSAYECNIYYVSSVTNKTPLDRIAYTAAHGDLA